MLPTINHCLTKLSPWTTTSARRRTARGSSALARPTLSNLTRSTNQLKVVEATDSKDMEATSVGAMATTSMVTGPMVDSEAVTPMDIPMAIPTVIVMATTMGTMDSRVLTEMARRTCQKLCASSARRMDTMLISAQR